MSMECQGATQSQSVYDVIISGAGPVGLFLASELAAGGCSVLILEGAKDSNSPLKRIPFGIRGLSAPTIDALDRRGLLEELEVHKTLRNPHKTSTPEGPGRQIGHFAGIPLLAGNVDSSRWTYRLPSSTDPSLISTMEEMETVLARRAEVLGVQIQRGLAVTGFDQTGDGVTVAAGERSFQGRWLVGCDGSRSVVRKAGDFEFAGTEPEFTGYSMQANLADAEKLRPGRNMTANGMYFQSQPGYLLMLEFDGGRGHLTEPLTLERCQETLRRVSNTDVRLEVLHAATTWTDRSRQTTTYRKGRVLLAGDAAHLHSPLGGQGLNLGIGDAMNLGWKLAATIQGRAPEGLLDTYQAERLPLGAQVLDWSRAQVSIMKPDPASRAMNAVVRDLMSTRDGATYIAERVWGVSTHYDLGGEHELVGYSTPNFEFEDGSTVGELLRDGQGILLDFEGSASLKGLSAGWVKYVSRPAKQRFDLSAVLIRPDGIIAWATDSGLELGELRGAAARGLERWISRKVARPCAG